VEILALGPDGTAAFQRYWLENELPFVGLPDPHSQVAARFYQEVNLFKLGRMPAILVIDRDGMIRYAHYGVSMADIPENRAILEILDRIE
jgi:peroxiredoxin Q/BCP